jgi:hypothetical protein
MPTISIESGIDGTHAYLRAKAVGYLVDKLRAAYCCTIHAHLVGSRIQQALNIGKLVYSSAHGEGDVYLLSHTRYHIGKRLATFEAGCDVEKAQFVGTLLAVGFSQSYRVASRAQVNEVGALNGLAILHIQTGYYSFC